MCIQIESNDCKKLQEVYFYLNKPVVVGNCLYNGKKSKNPYVICNYIWHMSKSVLWATMSEFLLDLQKERVLQNVFNLQDHFGYNSVQLGITWYNSVQLRLILFYSIKLSCTELYRFIPRIIWSIKTQLKYPISADFVYWSRLLFVFHAWEIPIKMEVFIACPELERKVCVIVTSTFYFKTKKWANLVTHQAE